MCMKSVCVCALCICLSVPGYKNSHEMKHEQPIKQSISSFTVWPDDKFNLTV